MKDHLLHKDAQPIQRSRSPLAVTKLAFGIVGAVVLTCALTALFFVDPFVNSFIKPKIVAAIAEAFPAYRVQIGEMTYSPLRNRLECDSVSVTATDGAFSGTLGPISVSGIRWNHLLWGGRLGLENMAEAHLDARDIDFKFPASLYTCRVGRLLVSVPDSTVACDSLRFLPTGGDEEFFAGRASRRTRFSIGAPHWMATGVACAELFQGRAFLARSILVQQMSLDILVNKEKPEAEEHLRVSPPSTLLASIVAPVRVDSVSFTDGGLVYGERFAVGEMAAQISCDSLQILAQGFANHGDQGATIVINAEGTFMSAGTMKLLMTLPVGLPDTSFAYSGSLSGMDLRPLNRFLEVSEGLRIKAGVLQGATFAILATAGWARGNVRVGYSDLILAAIDKETGDESGLSDEIKSFIANTFVIHGANVPDGSGAMKIGRVDYRQKQGESYPRFAWCAIRSGVLDIVER